MEQTVVKKSKALVLMKALLIAYVVTAAALFLLAFLLFRFEWGESKVNMGITIIYIVSCFFGGFALGKGVENRKFLWGMVLGLCYGVLLIGVTLLVEHKLTEDTSQIMTTILLCMAGGTLGGMLS